MNPLKSKHTGQTAWIVGKGPSLEHLRPDHFGPGPVITLNHAILAVESLNLPNPIYSMQKDGACARPEKATLILHNIESGNDFPDYPDRVVFALHELELTENVFSLAFAIRVARYMGCSELRLVCCDLQTTGDRDYYIPGEGIAGWATYLNQKEQVPQYLAGINHKFITPQLREVVC